MADSKSAAATTPARRAGTNDKSPGGKNGITKSAEEELKDDKFQGTGDSELDTTPPAKEGPDGGAAGRNRKSHGAETDVDTDSTEGQ